MAAPRLDERPAAPPQPRRQVPAPRHHPLTVWLVALGLLGLRVLAGTARALVWTARRAAALGRIGIDRWRADVAPAARRAHGRAAHHVRTVLLPAARTAAHRTARWWERRALPNLLVGGLLAALGIRSLARRLAVRAGQVDRALGRAAARLDARCRDAATVLLVVHVPVAWAWSRRHGGRIARTSGRGARMVALASGRAAVSAGRTTAAGTRRGAAWLRPRLPAIARRTAVAAVALGLLGGGALIGGDLVLRAAARSIDVATLPPLAQPSTVVAADGAVLARIHDGVRRRPVPLDDVPAHVQAAVLAAEDASFHEHRGYDLGAIARAAAVNLRAGRAVQGGSTITQQLAKQTYVGDERVLRRKLEELVHAVALERQHGKDAILERYLNHVYLGAGAYGIAEAAEEYFGASVSDLTVGQGALLAALIRAPSSFEPRGDLDAAARRRDGVLRRMAAVGFLDAEELAAAAAEPLEVTPPRREPESEPYVVAAVERELLADPAFADTAEERRHLLATGGLRIETTIRPELQEIARETVAHHLPDGELAAAIATVEAGSGRILALHGGRDFTVAQFDLATQARRQPGSLLKPFLAIAALEEGWDPAAPLDGSARSTYELVGERWVVSNFRGVDHGTVDLRAALVSSVNTAFADLAERVGYEALIDVTARLGIEPERAYGPAATHGPSIVLGGLTNGVSPLEMAGAYTAFVDDGRFAVPRLVERVVGPDGEDLHRPADAPTAALEPEATHEVADALRDVVTAGTGRDAAIPGRDVLGKTGTTTDGADAWFAGAAAPLSTAVWVGHPTARTAVAGSTGGRVAAPLWRDYTARALEALEATEAAARP